jgi:UTP--glucose-1-phosphate uridylyltransferase
MSGLADAQARMRDAGVPQRAIDVFSDFYAQLEAGATGLIAESDVEPIEGLDRLGELAVDLERCHEAAAVTCLIKLNGGLGTSMGMDRAKSLLPVRGERSFLDVIGEQVTWFRAAHGVRLPVLFMNSFRTHDDTAAALAGRELEVDGLPLGFLQNCEPKLRAEDLTPIDWPDDPSLEWCPPGHGDLYTALETSGILDALLAAGYRYASVSNADNLGATPDLALMGWFAATGAPFAAEVARRGPADVKGGHLVRRKADGRMVLRESAQVADGDREAAGDIARHRFFNTNSLWFDLVQLKETLTARAGVLGLPLIRNVKRVDPSRPDSPQVIQIESAMGAAIEVFAGATAIEVDRSRFLPVKTTDDLLLLRSDVYADAPDGRVVAKATPPWVDLDRRYFTTVADFDARIPSPPSLVDASSLTVRGDWRFGQNVVVAGEVRLAADEGAAREVPDGARLG